VEEEEEEEEDMKGADPSSQGETMAGGDRVSSAWAQI
jgi:hypothetical protein